jgi:hypothetical protein
MALKNYLNGATHRAIRQSWKSSYLSAGPLCSGCRRWLATGALTQTVTKRSFRSTPQVDSES